MSLLLRAASAFITTAALALGGFLPGAASPASASVAPAPSGQAAGANLAPTTPFRPGGRDVLILLDTSGSMQDKDSKGVVKIGAAKSAILQQVQEVPVTARLGLMTYPSGSVKAASGCSTAQLRLPVSSSSVSEMGVTLGGLPKSDGGTPTSDALLEAARYLKAEAMTDVTIVLVSDGESNCGGSPCETAKKLKSENINVTVNTVGFDISSSGQSELECVAAAAGGVYVNAQDASQLTQVLKDQLGNGLGLSIAAPSGPVPMLEATFEVEVRVSVAAGHNAANVQLEVADTDPASGSTVRRPVMALGNLGSGTSIPTKWLIRPPTNPKLDKSTYRVTVKTDGAAVLSKEFQVSYTHEQPTGANLSGTLKDFKNVVVLGDSYSSGEGAGDTARPYFQVADQTQACHRTKNQYANWLYSPEQVRILACSGAVSLNVYRAGQHGEESQLDQLRKMLATGYRPDAVFLSITGNDIGFGDIAQACGKSALASSAAAQVKILGPLAVAIPGPLASIRNLAPGLVTNPGPLASCPASEVSGKAYSAVLNLVDSVPGYLMTVLRHTSWVFEKDNKIEVPPIIVLKYPQLLARDDDTPLRCQGNHVFQSLALGAAFSDFSELQGKLNDKIDEGARLAQNHGVPVYVAGTDRAIPPAHNMCSADPWFVPATFKETALQQSPESLHPTVAGHQAIAARINSWAASEGQDLKPASTSVGEDAAWKQAALQWWPTASEVSVPLDQPNRTALPIVKNVYGMTLIHVSGGSPFTGTTIFVESRPLVLGHVQLDEQGNGSLTVDLQARDLPPGEHTVKVLGTARDGKAVVSTVPISMAQPFPLAFWIIGLIGVALLAAAVRILLKNRRQEPTSPIEGAPAI